MNALPYSLCAAILASGIAHAQPAYTTPVGYVSQTCKAGSDTIVGIPLRQSAVAEGSLSVDPDATSIPGSAVLTLTGNPGLTVNAYANSYYAKFKTTTPVAAAGDGQWFAITANTANTITVDLNGATILAVSGANLQIQKFWTLAELFNPTVCTTDPTTTGNAIVASISTTISGRRTTVLLPDLISPGINLAPPSTFYVNAGVWKKHGQGNTDFGNTQLWPDTYFVIRNPSSVTSATTYTNTGEVETGEFDVSLITQNSVSQDNFIALPRPTDTTLNSLNLGGTSAFASSTSTQISGRRDQLLLFDNTASSQNKPPAVTYYYHLGIWKKHGQGDTDFGNDVISAGSGFIIRKYKSGTGVSGNWNNTPAY